VNRLNPTVPPNTVRADRLRALVLDWAGTTVDFGSLAPARIMQRLFGKRNIDLSEQEARQHMGLPKKEHIRGILSMPRVREAWKQEQGVVPADPDVEAVYAEFIPLQFSCLMNYSAVIPGVTDTVAGLRARGLKIGSTTGYTREMTDLPFMMFECAVRLQVYPMAAIAKVGDTPADIHEGLNAGSWAIGVAATGNGIGLSLEDFHSLPEAEKEARLFRAREELRTAGAHYVIDSIGDLIPVLDDIEERLRGAL